MAAPTQLVCTDFTVMVQPTHSHSATPGRVCIHGHTDTLSLDYIHLTSNHKIQLIIDAKG